MVRRRPDNDKVLFSSDIRIMDLIVYWMDDLYIPGYISKIENEKTLIVFTIQYITRFHREIVKNDICGPFAQMHTAPKTVLKIHGPDLVREIKKVNCYYYRNNKEKI